MNASGSLLLSNPHPCGHIVYPYTDEGLVGQAVALYASAGLRDGDGVILIMSADHCESFKLRLIMEGFDPEAYERSGQLVCIGAEYLLDKFVVNGLVDESLFKSTVGAVIDQVRAKLGHGKPGKVRVFGEMVSQLRTGNPGATARLEELWNEIIQSHSVSLLCTYSLRHAGDHISESLIKLHSHNIERQEGYR